MTPPRFPPLVDGRRLYRQAPRRALREVSCQLRVGEYRWGSCQLGLGVPSLGRSWPASPPATCSPTPQRSMRGGSPSAECGALELAAEFGTPVFVYDEEHLRARCRQAVAALPGGAVYATKAFHCVAMARLADEEGMLLDVASGGEMHVALAAGVPPDKLVLPATPRRRGTGRGARVGVGRIVVDSFDPGWTGSIVSPVTGRRRSSCGSRQVSGAHPSLHRHRARRHEVRLHRFDRRRRRGGGAGTGVALDGAARPPRPHRQPGVPARVVRSGGRIVAAVARPFGLPELSLGGGLGVPYVEGEEAPGITDWIETIERAVGDEGVTSQVLVEPGRVIVAAAAVTLYSVMAIKEIPGIRTYLAVDGGMSDNPRSGALRERLRDLPPQGGRRTPAPAVTVVGKHCESGDVLVARLGTPMASRWVTSSPPRSPAPTAIPWDRPTRQGATAGRRLQFGRLCPACRAEETNEDLLRLERHLTSRAQVHPLIPRPRSSGGRALASGARCAGSNPAEGALHQQGWQ